MEKNQYCRRTISLFAAAAAAVWAGMTSAQAQTAPTIAQQPASLAVHPGSNVSFSITAAGTGPLFYQWRFDGANIPALITTIAGNGSNAFYGNNVQATNASLNAPWGLALDASNNLYVADWQNSRIRKVAANGIITTFAGNGTTNFHGDAGAATSAGLNLPRGVSLDTHSNVFICDTGNNRIRRVALSNGVISTLVGGGTNTNNIGDGGAATNAILNGPSAVAVDTLSNLFIADTGNNRIRKVGTNGIIKTVAGGGTNVAATGVVATNAAIPSPVGIALDLFGNLFVSFSSTNGSGGVLTVGTNGLITLVGSTDFYSSYLTNASGLAVDALGDLLVALPNDDVVLEDAQNTGLFSIVAGTLDTGGFLGDGGFATNAELLAPDGVAADTAGDVFIADTTNNRIRKVVAQGASFSIADVTTNDAGYYDVVVTSRYGSVTSSVAFLSIGDAPGVTNETASESVLVGSNVVLSATATGDTPFGYQWQVNGTNLPVLITTVAGDGLEGDSGDGGQATNAALYAGSVAVDNLGDFFIADSANNRIREVNADGIITTIAGNGTNGFFGDGGPATNASLFNPAAVAVDSFGNLYIADEANNRIRQVDIFGNINTFAGDGTNGYSGDGEAATNADLANPTGVAVDAAGNVYIADQGNNRIRQVDIFGNINTFAGNGNNGFSGDGGAAINASLSNPQGVAVDGLGNIYIADSGNKRIRKVGPNGIIITVAGNGDAGYYGDGGRATNAFFESPASVAVDAFGNFYIADGTEHLRKVGLNGIISTVAGNAGLGFGGDGGSPTNSMLGEVYGLATDNDGDLFIADTGNNRIREINGFGPSLILNNFSAGAAGNYDLIVFNPFGSVTSAVTAVTVVLPPLAPLTASLTGGNTLTIQFSGTPGSNYVLQVTANLTPPVNWQSLATNVAGVGGSGTFTETNLLANPALFYRLALP